MAKAYPPEAKELCRGLYLKYAGQNHDAIEREMQKVYPGWRKSNLYDRGPDKTRRGKLGWINDNGFERSLELYTEQLVTGVNSDEQDLYIGIRNVRKTLQKKVEAGKCTKDELYQYRDFCKLEIEARKNLDLSRDNLETFVAGYEKLTVWMGEIDPKDAKVLVKHGPRLAELAEAHYGKQQQPEQIDDGAGPGEDEGGDESPGGLRLVK